MCPYHHGSREHRALLEQLAQRHSGDFSLPAFMRLTGRWLAMSAAAALALGLVFVRLFQHHSAAMTRATVYSQVAVSGGPTWASYARKPASAALLLHSSPQPPPLPAGPL